MVKILVDSNNRAYVSNNKALSIELDIRPLTVNPSTTSQTITAPSGTDGYSPITVNAVTSAIDSNITAENIKKDVTILGVTGTLEGGVTPIGTISITENGTYDVTNYASADVNVSGGGSFIGLNREVVDGKYSIPTTSFTFSLPSNAIDLTAYAMYYAFYHCTGLTSVDLSNLTTVSGSNAMNYAFYNCTGLTSVDLSSLTTVSGYNAMFNAFISCTGLTSIDLSSLTTVSGSSAMSYAFTNCTGLTSIDLSSLTTVSGTYAMSKAFARCTGLTSVLLTNLTTIGANNSATNSGQLSGCFDDCTNLTSITFPNLEKIYCTGGITKSYGTFADNNKVQKMYFPKLDTITYGSGASTSDQNACKNIFYGCSALTELHFASANQSAIEATAGYSTAWGRGAGRVTIYFDL